MPMKRKVTWATAQLIRDYHARTKATPRIIVHDLCLPISNGAVYAILVGRTYKSRVQKISSKAVLTTEQVREVKGLLKTRRIEYIALQFGVSFSTIQRIKYGYTWKDTR